MSWDGDNDGALLERLKEAVQSAPDGEAPAAAVRTIEALCRSGVMRPALRALVRAYVKEHRLLTMPDFDAITRTRQPGSSPPNGYPHVFGTVHAADVAPMTLPEVEAVYAGWLHDPDPVPTRVTHATYAANLALAGDPVWVALVGGSGWGKTERIMALARMPGIVLASSLKGEAALLSATPERDRAVDAHGGLLRRIAGKGILVIKDFTSILEMDRKVRGQVLAALREIYDGHWDREVGAEGGRTLTWDGKCGLLTGCTTAIDRAYGVMAEMGQRWLFLRLPPGDLDKTAGAALDQMGRETAMRAELQQATAGLLHHLPGAPHKVTPAVRGAIVGLANLASQARSPVHRDYHGGIDLIGDAEAPTRIIKQLGKLWEACGLLGLPEPESWEVVSRAALDSIPKLRGAVIRYMASRPADLASIPGPVSTAAVQAELEHPRRTVFRALEDLAAHHVVKRDQDRDRWALTGRACSWLASDAVPNLWGSTRGGYGTPDGQAGPLCPACGKPMDRTLAEQGITIHPTCEPPF
jgi:hypothetical protein